MAEREIDFVELIGFYRKKILLIVCAFLIGAVAAGVVTQFAIAPKYTATSKMYMVSSSSGSAVDLTDFNVGSSLSSDYVELVRTRPIVEDVIRELKLKYTYKELLDMMDLSTVTDTRILKIRVTGKDKKEVAAIANSLAEKAEKELPNLMDTPKPHIAEKAIVPTTRSSPSLTRNTMLGAVIALLLMLGALTVIYLRDDTIKSAEELEKAFKVMPLTIIPEGKINRTDTKKITSSRKESHEKQ